MINKYRNANKDLKEYKATRVKTGVAKNGANYTIFQISDTKKDENGKNIYDNYSVFSWQENLNLNENDKIAILDITGIEIKTNEFNNKTYIDKTLFAEIKITQQSSPNKVEVVGDMPNFGNSSDSLPF